MTRFAILALLLAGCSRETPSMPPATPAAPATPVARALAVPAATPVDGGARPAPAEPRTFGDWTVACDNARRCTMASLGAEGGDFPTWTMAVTRAAGVAGGYEIALDSTGDDKPGVDKGVPASIAIDGHRFAVAGSGLSGGAAMKIATAMANGRTLAVHDAGGASLATISLKGASAALRFIDAGQARAGTVTATVATGAATAVPPAPPLPIVVALASGGTAATPTAAQWAQMREIGDCEERMADAATWTPRRHALGGGATLILLPCSAGAYNEIDALFVLRDGRVTPAEVDAPSGFAPAAEEATARVRSVINGGFDAGSLTSYGKGRGLGDCGVAQSFAWDGTRLRLTEQSVMGECRGNPHFLTVWRTRVIRK